MSTRPGRIFSPKNRVRILAGVPGMPSGVIFAIGGVEIDLLAISTKQLADILELADKATGAIDAVLQKKAANDELLELIGKDMPMALAIAKDILRRSALYVPIGDEVPDLAEESTLFEEWFDGVPAVELLKGIVPKLLEANGLGAALQRNQNPPTPVMESVPEPATDSNLATVSASS